MNAPYYMSEATWRTEMLAAQAGTKQAVRELSFLISALALAFGLSEYFAGLAPVVAAFLCAGCIYTLWRENRSQEQFASEMTGVPELEH
jgi:hypothetical protein